MVNRKKKRGIEYNKTGEPKKGFQNDLKILFHCSRKLGATGTIGISPYILMHLMAESLSYKLAEGSNREKLDNFVEHLIRHYKIQKVTRSKKPKPNNRTKKISFYSSWEWRRLRYKIIQKYGGACMCCGATKGDVDISGRPVRIVVDHIKPISKYWELRLDGSNLQILCDECNMGKGAWDETDHRPS